MTDESKQAVTAEATVEKKEKAPVKARAKKGKKAHVQVPHVKAFIQATYNNTIVSIADLNGNVLGWSSAGKVGFKGPKKATPYAASMIVRDVVEKLKDYGMKDVSVFIAGPGQGREGALRAMNANGLNVLNIKDMTPVPHNGCRARRPRRV